jgi:glutathione synthase/RimK-type ligase-like ATP-grasp enzyme
MNDKERLLALFCRGVRYPQSSGFEVLELLDVRSALARWEEELTKEQRESLEEADELFLTNAGQFYENVVQVADLAEMRQRAGVPPSHWWWYLEKLVRTERVAL